MDGHHSDDTKVPHEQQCSRIVHWDVVGSQEFPGKSGNQVVLFKENKNETPTHSKYK